VEWSGVEWSGVEWSGVEWSGVEWSGVEWSGVECYVTKKSWQPLTFHHVTITKHELALAFTLVCFPTSFVDFRSGGGTGSKNFCFNAIASALPVFETASVHRAIRVGSDSLARHLAIHEVSSVS